MTKFTPLAVVIIFCSTIFGQSYKIGEEMIKIPSPSKNIEKVDKAGSEYFAKMVTKDNRLITAFAAGSELKDAIQGRGLLPEFAFVTIYTPTENKKSEQKLFDMTTGNFKNSLSILPVVTGNSEKEIDTKMKEMSQQKGYEGLPVSIGELFSESDRYGFGLISSFPYGDKEIKMIKTGIFIYVKNKILTLYLHKLYDGKSSVDWMKKTTKEWAEKIISLNKA